MNRVLERQTVLITRSVQSSGDRLGQMLERVGAQVVYGPVIRILPPISWDSLDQGLESIENYGGCVFLSQHGVQAFCQRVEHLGMLDCLEPEQTRLSFFCVGEGTQAELKRLSGCSSLIPQESNSLAMSALLKQHNQMAPFLVVRGNRGSRVLQDNLTAAGINYEQVQAYRSVDIDIEELSPQLQKQMNEGQFDWITVTSSAIANSLIRLFGDSLRQARLASISPTTSEVLTSHGFEPAAEAAEYNFVGLVDAMGRQARP